MEAKKAIKEIMKACGWSQEKLAEKCGMKSQSNITGILNRNSSLRVDVFLKMIQAMGFELVVRDTRKKEGGKPYEFVIDKSEKEEK